MLFVLFAMSHVLIVNPLDFERALTYMKFTLNIFSFPSSSHHSLALLGHSLVTEGLRLHLLMLLLLFIPTPLYIDT